MTAPDKVAFITGANKGIGLETARGSRQTCATHGDGTSPSSKGISVARRRSR